MSTIHPVEREVLEMVQHAGARMEAAEYIALIDRVRAVLAIEAARCDDQEAEIDPEAFKRHNDE